MPLIGFIPSDQENNPINHNMQHPHKTYIFPPNNLLTNALVPQITQSIPTASNATIPITNTPIPMPNITLPTSNNILPIYLNIFIIYSPRIL